MSRYTLRSWGGGFGRRYTADFQTEGAQIARHVSTPVQLVWTREDDMAHDFYRPAGMRRMRGAVDAQGNVVAWTDHVADTAIGDYWSEPGKYKPDGGELPGRPVYPHPRVRMTYSPITSGVPRAWWRSVGNSQNGAAVEYVRGRTGARGGSGSIPVSAGDCCCFRLPASEDKPNPDETTFRIEIGWWRCLILLRRRATGENRWDQTAAAVLRAPRCMPTWPRWRRSRWMHDNIRVDRLVTVIDCRSRW